MARSYVAAPGVRALRVGGRSLIYVEHQQQVLELNATAELVWRGVTTAAAAPAMLAEFDALGLSRRQAGELVDDAVRQWTRLGYLVDPRLDELLQGNHAADRTLVIDELVVDLRVRGVDADVLDPVFGQFYGHRDGARHALTIVGQADRLLLYVGRRLAGAGDREGYVAQVKAVLTDLYLDAVEDGFLAHGASLARGGRGLLLLGAPGAGKTTLALALAAAGWRYGGDDIVRVRPDGAMRGVPFAAAIKAGGAPLLREWWPQLASLPAWIRPDGQLARYLLPANRMAAADAALDVVVLLARRPGAGARLAPVSPLEAMNGILQGAYASRWRMTAEAFGALAQAVERATCLRLEYAGLEPAVQAIEEFARVEVQPA